MGIDINATNQLRVHELEISDGRVWYGNTLNSLPHGWGQVVFNGLQVWSHFCLGIPHFTGDTVLPDEIIQCEYIGKEGLRFSGFIDMGIPISGTIIQQDYKFSGLFDPISMTPSHGIIYYNTVNGEAQWSGHLDTKGDRQGKGVMQYADNTLVEGIWKDDEIMTEGSIWIHLKSDIEFDVIMIHGYCLLWPSKELWNIIQRSLVRELFHETYELQQNSFQLYFSNRLQRVRRNGV